MDAAINIYRVIEITPDLPVVFLSATALNIQSFSRYIAGLRLTGPHTFWELVTTPEEVIAAFIEIKELGMTTKYSYLPIESIRVESGDHLIITGRSLDHIRGPHVYHTQMIHMTKCII